MNQSFKPGDEPVPGYHLVKYLGAGNYGQVWQATAPGRIPVAFKILQNLATRPGVKELRALHLLKEIRHPQLVALQGYWLTNEAGHFLDESAVEELLAEPQAEVRGTMRSTPLSGTRVTGLYIAMGLGDKTVFDRLHECQATGLPGIPPAELISYIQDAARGIDFLNQEKHIQHCDIKPQNILVVGGGAQVCDFGLAKVITASLTGTTSRTLGYSAPEVDWGQGPSQATDQYSLAISYYELRTGQLPYTDEDMTSEGRVMIAKKEQRLSFDLVTPPEQEVLRRACSLHPASRFASACRFAERLRRCFPNLDIDDSVKIPPKSAKSQSTTSSPPPPAPVSKSSHSFEVVAPPRSRAMVMGTFVGLLCIGAAIVAYVGWRTLGGGGTDKGRQDTGAESKLEDQFTKSLRNHEYTEAVATVRQLGAFRPGAGRELYEDWLASIRKLQASGDLDQALANCQELLIQLPQVASSVDLDEAHVLRRSLISEHLSRSEQLLAAGNLDDALNALRQVIGWLTELPERGDSNALERAQLDEARAWVRQEPPDSERTERRLADLESKRADLPPRERRQWLTLQLLLLEPNLTTDFTDDAERSVGYLKEWMATEVADEEPDAWEQERIGRLREKLAQAYVQFFKNADHADVTERLADARTLFPELDLVLTLRELSQQLDSGQIAEARTSLARVKSRAETSRHATGRGTEIPDRLAVLELRLDLLDPQAPVPAAIEQTFVAVLAKAREEDRIPLMDALAQAAERWYEAGNDDQLARAARLSDALWEEVKLLPASSYRSAVLKLGRRVRGLQLRRSLS